MSATLKMEVSKTPTIWLALELAMTIWKVAFTAAGLKQPSVHDLEANDFDRLESLIELMRQRLGLPDASAVICYEAGRHGHYIARELQRRGYEVFELDSSSIERPRRKYAKSDTLDARALVSLLRDWREGRRRVSQVHIPSLADEVGRNLHREREHWKKLKLQNSNRFESVLVRHGCSAKIKPKRNLKVAAIRDFRGEALPAPVQAELQRLNDGVLHARAQIKAIEAEQARQLSTTGREAADATQAKKLEMIEQLMALVAVGHHTAWILVHELFGWRVFRNRRQLSACVGLCPTPYNSGQTNREQGISKAGNAKVRALLIQLAWRWLRKQPDSELSSWFRGRFDYGTRSRKSGIVAVARKLTILLWRYLQNGELPPNVQLKLAA
jgi:transposase